MIQSIGTVNRVNKNKVYTWIVRTQGKPKGLTPFLLPRKSSIYSLANSIYLGFLAKAVKNHDLQLKTTKKGEFTKE